MRLRGGGYSNTVSPETWALFEKRLKEAATRLRNAPPGGKDTPLWHQVLLEVQLDRNGAEADVQGVFEEAVLRWPDYYPFYERMAQRLVPKWGGSWLAVEAFAASWARKHRDGDAFYTRIYLSIRGEGAVGELAFDWQRMKSGFRQLLAQYPDPYLKNNFASYACAIRDRAAYLEAMKLIDKESLREEFWLKGNSHEACGQWGSTDV